MWYSLYNLFLSPLWLLLIVARLFSRGNLRERLGEVDPTRAGADYWIHCASVGELSSIPGLLREIRRREPGSRIVISTMTATGRERASELFPDIYSFLAPVDSPVSVIRVLERVDPRALLVAETELWPVIFGSAHRRGIPVVIVNGRLTARSLRRYLLFRPLFKRALRGVSALFVQTEKDRLAYAKLGVPQEKIKVTGSMKPDFEKPSVTRDIVREEFSIPEEALVVVAGSVRPDEEKDILLASRRVLEGCRSAYLVIAPRHLERARTIGMLAGELGMVVRYRSSGNSRSDEKVLILDSLGELVKLYAAADVSFVGGSLKPYGGHNVLEPAMWGVPVLFGPFTRNCSQEAEELILKDGGIRVTNWEELASRTLALLKDVELRRRMGSSANEIVKDRSGASGVVCEDLFKRGILGGVRDRR